MGLKRVLFLEYREENWVSDKERILKRFFRKVRSESGLGLELALISDCLFSDFFFFVCGCTSEI